MLGATEKYMIFGDKSDFAIEAMVEPELVAPSHPWGRLCVWVSGSQIGDFDEPHCGLYPCYESFQGKCEELNDLWVDAFLELSDLDIWNFLDGLLYGYHGNKELEDERTLEQMLHDSDIYSKFNFLTNWGEMFDRGGKSFILKLPSGQIKILNFNYEKEAVNTYLCSELAFRRASRGFTIWYAEQLKALDSENA